MTTCGPTSNLQANPELAIVVPTANGRLTQELFVAARKQLTDLGNNGRLFGGETELSLVG